MLYRIRVHVLPTIQCFLWGKNPRNDHIKEELAINRGMEHPPSFWGGNLVVGAIMTSAVECQIVVLAVLVLTCCQYLHLCMSCTAFYHCYNLLRRIEELL